MKITGFTVEKLEDPFGILSGDRYELYLDIEVDEDDELYLENGLRLKVLYVAEDGEGKIVSYSLLENTTDKYIDLALEAEELEIVAAFCKENLE
ncbi:MAG: hypothetical protein K0S25_274 [Bacillus sp. (in: firmicutes)]|jgi:hypothetical protein|nr:hypothetical protein [Bacillus sp. (in: firmicutes)]